MIIIYEKGTNKFLGATTQVFDNGTWREATLEELYPNADRSKMGFVTVKDSIKYVMAWNEWEFKLDSKGVPVDVVRKSQPDRLNLETDAKDTDGDGMPELPADGKSKATINIDIKNPKGNLVKDETTILISTTAGALSDRRITTKTGKAKLTLTASHETVTATVTAKAEGMAEASLTFEFMPS
ncbi:MAG: Ig-like domain-containing protein [Lewinellaceae bacterium]|nr:Ig-like domain-containing protein [Saprospiraceae bacterium]MCB9337625.1 Ig-like domain-containing protein [Lewinellaceae bacterium]